MKRKILASLLGVFMLCGLPAQAQADGEGEDLSEYDIDLDLTEGHAYEFYYDRSIIEVHAFDNEGNACAATAGIISGGSFLSVKPKSPSNTTQIQVALKEPEQPCRLMAGTYDVYVVMVPDYYKAPEEEPEVKAKTKMSATLFYHNSMADQRPVRAERYDFEYNGEKVDTVLLYEGLDIPTSYYGFRDFFPYLQLASRKASLTEQNNGYIHAFSVDRVILKARSVTDREPVTVYTGTCGENATYLLDITTGLLTISGTGTLTAAPQLASPLWSCVEKIVIEKGITAIGPKVFQHIGSPTILPETLQAIGDSAFYWSSIRDIKLPEGLQTIGKDAFSYCDSLSSVSFPSTLQSIGDRAFRRTNVREIEIPVNVKTLGNDIFVSTPLETVYWNAADCRYDAGTHPFLSVKGGIRSFHIGEQVRHIPACLCSGMGGLLEDFRMGENVETIGDSAFFSFRPWLLDSIDIPATTTSIAGSAFVNADLAAINVAAGNGVYCDVDGILFSKNLTSLVYYPKYANRSMRYTVPSTVKSLGECAFADYLPSSLVLPWADAESIPLAAPTTFRNDIVFYVPNEALGDYQSLSPYSSHDIITRANLAWYMAGSERFSVFNKLLVATGWADTLKAERDEEYERLYAEGKLSSAPDLNSYTRTEGYPSERKYGFTILAETDSVYEAMTGLKAADITAESVAMAIESLGVQGGVNSKDYTAADNALNRFVSYHLLNVALPAGRLVNHTHTYGYDKEANTIGVNVTEYYETLGAGRRLLKMSESDQSDGVRINRYVKMNPETGADDAEETYGFIPGIRLERDAQRMVNGYVYALAEPLVYTDETAAKVLGSERMRHDIAALLPELYNNGIRASKDVVFCSGSDYPYFDNLVTSENTYTYYLSGYYLSGESKGWYNYQADELDFNSKCDLTIKLPAVPVSGEYELRIGVQSNSYRRGVYQFMFGKDKDNLNPCGLPVDMRTNNIYESFGIIEDTGVEMLDRMSALQLREKGVMKAPQSIAVGGQSLRNNRFVTRRIIDRVRLEAGETYYLRIFDCRPTEESDLYLDYLEWVPKSVYANPVEAEDIW